MNALLRSFAAAALLCAQSLSAATIDVDVANFRFAPNDITINVGDTVRWTNSGGLHNVAADGGLFASPQSATLWTFTHSFTFAGDFPYHCMVHSSVGQDPATNMNGIVRVREAPPPFAINQGIGGSWLNPATSGQGFLIDLLPASNFMFVAWFTFEKAQPPAMAFEPKVGALDHRWMTASGNFTPGGSSAPLTLYVTTGGLFDNPQTVNTTAVGTMTLDFTDCSHGTITYSIPGESLSGTIPISRQTTGMAAYCRSLAPATASAAGSAEAAQ